MHTDQTYTTLLRVFERPKRTVVLVSGGKDSLTLLHTVRPWRDLVTVLHLHEPDGWPDVTSNLITQMNEWGFLRSVQILPQMTFEQYVEEFGWPVGIVPTEMDGVSARPMSPFYTGGVKMASWWHCSLYRHLVPLGWALATLQAEVVLTGTRGGDAPFFAQTPQWTGRYEGWQRVDPIHHWSVAQVYAYIEENGITLPQYYSVKRLPEYANFEWLDCISCCWKMQHWKMLKEHYPEEYEKRWPTVAPVFAALKEKIHAAQNELDLL